MLSDQILPDPIVMPAKADASDRGIHSSIAEIGRRQARRFCRATSSSLGNGARLGGRGDGYSEDVA